MAEDDIPPADGDAGNPAFEAWLANLNQGFGFERIEYDEGDVLEAFEAGAASAGDDLETVTVLLAEAKTGLEEASDALTTLSDVAVRMELALRMINHFAMGPIALPESGMVRDWIKDWIEGRNHGPVGGPMLWPAASKLACAQLRGWGFTRSEGNPGYVVLRRRPSGGEAVQ